MSASCPTASRIEIPIDATLDLARVFDRGGMVFLGTHETTSPMSSDEATDVAASARQAENR